MSKDYHGRACSQAPAKKLAEYGDALQEELGSGTSALHHSTRSVVKGTVKNASRQYQRATRRFKMAMPPDLCLGKLCTRWGFKLNLGNSEKLSGFLWGPFLHPRIYLWIAHGRL